jgi:phage shock protein C
MTEPVKKLYRSVANRMLGGVCAGIGEYLSVDPTVIRILFVLGIFISVGMGALVYLALWMIIPQEPLDQPPQVWHMKTDSCTLAVRFHMFLLCAFLQHLDHRVSENAVETHCSTVELRGGRCARGLRCSLTVLGSSTILWETSTKTTPIRRPATSRPAASSTAVRLELRPASGPLVGT